ncbi:MAG: hypothetical protein KKD21_13990 [Proteobacteria bacterium]|nr:hypothetical protein [Pseudomonadota bacterium]MBU1698130.1 hypothetical protein [Pseudomonadota bacterium]
MFDHLSARGHLDPGHIDLHEIIIQEGAVPVNADAAENINITSEIRLIFVVEKITTERKERFTLKSLHIG